MILKNITLLTEDEFNKYKSIIPVIEHRWWLRTPAPEYDDCTRVINWDGFLSRFSDICRKGNTIRPSCIFGFDPSDIQFWYKPEKLIGTKIEYGKYQWTVLSANFGEIYALCDNVITYRRFDPVSNDWNESELKQWLETDGLNLITS